MTQRRLNLWMVLFTLAPFQAVAALRVTLASSLPSPQPLGKPIQFSAAAADTNPGAFDYRFRLGLAGEPLKTVKDFQPKPDLTWAPYLREGQFAIEVTARNKSTLEEATNSATFQITPRASGDSAVLTETGNRLVWLYSAPPCKPGSSIRARFRTGLEPPQYTPFQGCEPGVTRNFYIAGIRAQTEYLVTQEVKSGSVLTAGEEMKFATLLPDNLRLPAVSVTHALDANGCQLQPILLQRTFATDLSGRVVWYGPDQQTVTRYLPGGRMLTGQGDKSISEIDLAGNIVWETTSERVSEQLKARNQDPILGFHHDVILLPNGHILTLGNVLRVLHDTQGPGDVRVIGDVIIELNENLQVVWTWNTFDHLDPSRKATLGEACPGEGGGCPTPAWEGSANDWTHSNSLAYTNDGNLLLSVRHQDWVVKIDYQNGAGSGRILWRLGRDGDFKILSADPDPWFSHQHDVEFDVAGYPALSLYDNGNLRHAKDPAAHSRGQVLWLDEAQRLAIPLVNADLGVYSWALGSAQRLCNGNYSFNSGAIQQAKGGAASRSTEVTLNGSVGFILENPGTTYRSFRLSSMYEQ